MADEPECQLRRRRLSGQPSLPLNLELGKVNEGNSDEDTPSSPSKPYAGTSKRSSSAALLDYKNKQQSFDIQIEECEEEEIIVDSDDEGEPDENGGASGISRAVTPTPIQDFGANVTYFEGPQATDFLKVKTLEADCYTDVSDADTEEE